MGKNIIIKNGSDPVQYLNGVTRIRTALQEGGYCDWVPEDEVGESENDANLRLAEKTISRNGEYNAANDGLDGYSVVNVISPYTGRADALFSGNTEEIASIIEKSIVTLSNRYANTVRDRAFADCSRLTTVDLPLASYIGDKAFYNCSRLETAKLPSASYISDSAFYNCSSLTTIDMRSTLYIGDSAFYNCTGIIALDFQSVSYIGYYAFYNCTGITAIDFPLVSYIGNSAFADCFNLISANLPSAFYIGYRAFEYCRNLTILSLPFVNTINDEAFRRCASLVSVHLPLVEYIGASAFYGCSKLVDVFALTPSVPSLYASNAFNSTPLSLSAYTGTYGSIFVLPSMVETFKIADNWSYYSNRITAYEEE